MNAPAPSAESELPDGWRVDGSKAWQERGVWRTEINLSDTGNVGVGFSYTERDHHMGGSFPLDVLRQLLSRAGLAIVPVADVPSPISDETLRHLTECAHSWEPDACLLGNVTARQLQAFCAELAKLRADVPSSEERKVLEAIDGCCKFSLSELHERYPSLGPLADAVGAVRESRRAAKETDHADRSRRETGDW